MISQESLKYEEKAVLVGIELSAESDSDFHDHLEELAQLSETAGLEVTGILTQARERFHPAYLIGPGKVEDLRDLTESTNSNVVIFDEDLSPAQIRNIEKKINVKIIDRSTLILDVFAKHARTKEAKTQVELAQLKYLLPRLTRQWTHLSRQVGGIGTRGPGETQLETDRRLVRNRIEKLNSELTQISRQREVRRRNRKDMFRIGLVGYTNVGKSTIMNLLADTELLVENQLFATLDSTVRRVGLNNEHQVLLSDTVGFIRKLPTHLVASFKSTLDELREADLLLHVVDVNHPHFRDQLQIVLQILEDLDVHHKPILTVFNKVDLLINLNDINTLKNQYSNSVFISALRNIGLETLKKSIIDIIEKGYISAQFTVPVQEQKFIHYIYANTVVEKQAYENDKTILYFNCDRSVYEKILFRARKSSIHEKDIIVK